MGKHNAIDLYDRTQLGNEKEQTNYASNNMDESQKHIKWKKPHAKDHKSVIPCIQNSRKGKTMMKESKPAVTRGWGREDWLQIGRKDLSEVMAMFYILFVVIKLLHIFVETPLTVQFKLVNFTVYKVHFNEAAFLKTIIYGFHLKKLFNCLIFLKNANFRVVNL